MKSLAPSLPVFPFSLSATPELQSNSWFLVDTRSLVCVSSVGQWRGFLASPGGGGGEGGGEEEEEEVPPPLNTAPRWW